MVVNDDMKRNAVELALQVRRAKSTLPTSIVQHDTSCTTRLTSGFFAPVSKQLTHEKTPPPL